VELQSDFLYKFHPRISSGIAKLQPTKREVKSSYGQMLTRDRLLEKVLRTVTKWVVIRLEKSYTMGRWNFILT
jgi:hypothetical protein